MSTRFIISGRIYTETELIGNSDLGLEYGFVRDIQSFLEQWTNSSDSITAHTSGSTGTPKEIKLSKSAMKASAQATGMAFELVSDNTPKTISSPLSANYIAGMMMIVRALQWNVDLLCIPPSSDPLKYLDRELDFMVMTPHQLSISIDSGHVEKLGAVKKLLLGGSPIDKELQEKIQQLTCQVYLGYGMTETMSHIALKKLNGEDKADRYVAVEGVSFSQDSRDCLVIHASHLAITDLVTNDVVTLYDEGSFKWLGRFDHVINSGGIKLFPEIIEKRISGIIDRPFYIGSIKDKLLGEQLVIFLEGELPNQEKINEWKLQMSPVLRKYEMPRKWMSVHEFRYTETGKIKR